MNIGIVKVEQGKALIRSNVFSGEILVSFTGGFVWPVIHKTEIMDITLKAIEIDRSGDDSLICSDYVRADAKATFFIRINHTEDDIIKVAQKIGCNRASDPRTLEALFIPKFSEALKAAVRQIDSADLQTRYEQLRERIIEIIGTDLYGYALEDCAVNYLERTPMTELSNPDIQAAS